MRRRYFFFDYDGTLAIPRSYTIPESARSALTKLRENGHFIALATGRLQCNALDYIDSMGIDNLVADGGYSVTIDGDLKWMIPLPIEPVRACLRRLDAAGIHWAVTTKNEQIRYSPQPDFATVAGDYYVPTVFDPTITAENVETVYKIYIPCKRGDDQENLIASGVLDGVPWARYDSDNIFVEPTDKTIGIKRMMDLLGAPYEDVVVFGDGTNDLAMFIPEWTSIAMGNAVPELKERATFVTTDVDKDGLARACEHFGWI